MWVCFNIQTLVIQCWASSCLVTIHTTDDNFLKLFLSNHDDKNYKLMVVVFYTKRQKNGHRKKNMRDIDL